MVKSHFAEEPWGRPLVWLHSVSLFFSTTPETRKNQNINDHLHCDASVSPVIALFSTAKLWKLQAPRCATAKLNVSTASSDVNFKYLPVTEISCTDGNKQFKHVTALCALSISGAGAGYQQLMVTLVSHIRFNTYSSTNSGFTDSYFRKSCDLNKYIIFGNIFINIYGYLFPIAGNQIIDRLSQPWGSTFRSDMCGVMCLHGAFCSTNDQNKWSSV